MNDTPAGVNMPHIADVAWCPGCGSHMLQKAVKLALHELMIEQDNFVMVPGIGQAIKLSNRKLVVMAESGDEDMLGEESNHFLDAIRSNTDISVIVHNNMTLGLTRTQTSNSSQRGMKKPGKSNGVKPEPVNPVGVALAMSAPFIARAWAGDIEHTTLMIKAAIAFRGFSVIEVCQPCVVFNKLSTFQCFKNNIHYLPKGQGTSDRRAAFQLATGSRKLPLGIFFRHDGAGLYEDAIGIDTDLLFQHQQHYEKTFQTMIDACR